MTIRNPNIEYIEANKNKLRYILLQGGTRSGKTYSTLQFIIKTCYEYEGAGMTLSICRRTMPALKATAMRDFLDLLIEAGLYDEENHDKTDKIYHLLGNHVEFINLDDQQKVRGRKRHILYVNEANENDISVIRQLLFRTSGLCIFDYNPTILESHWLISDLLQREGAGRIITNYTHNPHLSKAQIEEIEHLKSVNPELWKVFGLGKIGEGLKGAVFPNWDYGKYEGKARIAYGLDFGFSPDPSSLIEVAIQGNNLYLKELFYRTNMTPDDLREYVNICVPRGNPVYCDHRTDLIQMLFDSGVNAKKAIKGADSIDTGVKAMQNYRIFVHPDSLNLQKEMKYYRYKEDKDGNPIGGKYSDSLNHAIDAARYGVMGLAFVKKATFTSIATGI